MKLKHCLSVIGIFLAASCLQDRVADSPSVRLLQESYEDIRIPEDNSLLYAMVPGLYDNLHTKSSDVEMISLESLIDRERASEEDFEEYHIVQIPFKDQENEMSVFLSDSVQQLLSMDNLSIVRKFLVLVENRQTSETMSIVTTFIPTQECLKEYGEQSFSYMDKSTYEGIVINSNLDGSFRSVYIYGDHPIIDGRIYEVGTENSTGCRYYLTLSKPCGTKGGNDEINGGEIAGSICIGEATKPKDDDDKKDNDSTKKDFDVIRSEFPGSGGGSGGAGGDSGDKPIDDDAPKEVFDTITRPSIIVADRIKDDVKVYTISLYSCGPGTVLKSGDYPKSKTIHCTALPEPGLSDFDRWTGDFDRYGPSVSIRVTKDIESTAYFFNILTDTTGKRPCYNKETGVYNPLKKMSIASPGRSGLRGGTFGMVRSGNTKNHSGIDLYAEPGTELYAMIDGVIDGSKYVIEQPDIDSTLKKRVYPPGYDGDKNDAGNRIYLKGQYGGRNVRLGYWHLQAGTPVAINPRTGKPFKPGDKVYKGELIAFTGRTGNAYNVPNKHLHLTYEVNGAKRNPEEIINGKVDWDETMMKVLSAALRFIKCDPEFSFIEIFKY